MKTLWITMINRKTKSVLLLMTLICSGSLSAEQIKRLEESWYVGGALGLSSLEPITPVGASVTDDKDVSLKVYAGVDISNQIGIEAFWSNLGESAITGSAGEGKIKYSALGINGIYHLPVYMNRVHPFGKLGLAKINTKTTGTVVEKKENDFTLFGGIGAEYDLSKGIKVRAEYEYFTKDISQLSVGLNWSPNERMHYLDTNRRSIPVALPMNYKLPQGKPIKAIPQAIPAATSGRSFNKVETLNSSLKGNSLFSSGSSRLSSKGISQLNQLTSKIRASSFKLFHIVVTGHTDNRGSHKQNIKLSKIRAESVARYLSTQGIPRYKMSVVGLGENKPVSSNKTAYGRALNRRVDITIKGASTFVVAR